MSRFSPTIVHLHWKNSHFSHTLAVEIRTHWRNWINGNSTRLSNRVFQTLTCIALDLEQRAFRATLWKQLKSMERTLLFSSLPRSHNRYFQCDVRVCMGIRAISLSDTHIGSGYNWVSYLCKHGWSATSCVYVCDLHWKNKKNLRSFRLRLLSKVGGDQRTPMWKKRGYRYGKLGDFWAWLGLFYCVFLRIWQVQLGNVVLIQQWNKKSQGSTTNGFRNYEIFPCVNSKIRSIEFPALLIATRP